MDPHLQAWNLHQQAEVCNDMRRYANAVELCMQALAIDPENPMVLGSLCRAHLGLTNYQIAEQVVRQALEKDGTNEWLLRMLAISLRYQGKKKPALAAAKQTVEQAPETAAAHIELAECYALCGKARLAHQHFDLAIEREPTNARAHSCKGYLLIQQKQWKRAEHHYRLSLKTNPLEALSLNNLGVCLNQQRKHLDAALAFKSAVLLDPNMKLARTNTRETVSMLLSNSPVTAGLVILGCVFLVPIAIFLLSFQLDTRFDPVIAVVFGTFLLACFAGFTLLLRFLRRRRIDRIRTEDPELLQIYQQIKKHG